MRDKRGSICSLQTTKKFKRSLGFIIGFPKWEDTRSGQHFQTKQELHSKEHWLEGKGRESSLKKHFPLRVCSGSYWNKIKFQTPFSKEDCTLSRQAEAKYRISMKHNCSRNWMQKTSVILESHIVPSGAEKLFLQVTKPHQNSNKPNYALVTWRFICWLEINMGQFDFIIFFSVFVCLSLILCGKFLIRAGFLWTLSIIHAWKVPTSISINVRSE